MCLRSGIGTSVSGNSRCVKQPHAGLIAPFETDIYIDSAAPTTRERLRLGFVEASSWIYSRIEFLFTVWKRWKTRVLDTLVVLTDWWGSVVH